MRLKIARFVLICALALVPAGLQAQPQTLVLTGGTVVDLTNWGRSARDLAGAVVVIRDGRIVEVGLPGQVSIPKGARVIDCAGKFLIPGLVDGYAGMNSQAQANANLYMGVTTVVARADNERGYIDFSAQPSPHIYAIDSIGVTDNWSLLARQPQWIGKLREGAHPVELSPQETARQMADTARRGTRVLLLPPRVTAANSQWIIAHAHEMGLITYGIFVSTPYRVGVEAGVDALPRMDRYDLGLVPDELQRPLVDAPFGGRHRLWLRRPAADQRRAPAQLRTLSGDAPCRADARLQPALRRAARPSQSVAGAGRRAA